MAYDSRSPPIIPDGQISRVRFETLAFFRRPSHRLERFKRWSVYKNPPPTAGRARLLSQSRERTLSLTNLSTKRQRIAEPARTETRGDLLPSGNSRPVSHGWCPLHHRERSSSMKNRKREICTSGTVRDEDGNILIYSAVDHLFAVLSGKLLNKLGGGTDGTF